MRDFAREAAADSAGAPFQRERQTVFAAHWLVFAASEQMPATGDYVMRNLGGWLLFAIRGEDGIARAFTIYAGIRACRSSACCGRSCRAASRAPALSI